MTLERWLLRHTDDWIDGDAGPETLRHLAAVPEERVPDDVLFYLAPSLAVRRASVLAEAAMSAASSAMVEESRKRAVALRVSDALSHAHVPHVFLKGADLRYRLYPDPLQRTCTDLDVLCRFEDRRRALDVLEHCGASISDDPRFFLAGYGYELPTVIDGVRVELHVSLFHPGMCRFDAAAVLEAHETVEIEGGSLPVARREDAVAICLLHIGRLQGAREYVGFKHAIDLVLALRTWDGLDWEAIARRTKRWRCRRIAGAGLWTWEPWLGEQIPAVALRTLDPGPVQRFVARRTPNVMQPPETAAPAALRARRFVLKLLFAEGLRERGWLVLEVARHLGRR